MKEIPLLFTSANRDLVRRGLKTETRREMKKQPHFGKEMGGNPAALLSGAIPMLRGKYGYVQLTNGDEFGPMRSPYGCPQQELVIYWMREPVQILQVWDHRESQTENGQALVGYLDSEDTRLIDLDLGDMIKIHARKDWRRPTTAMHMLKSFARTWLPGVRVWPEQLGEMSEESALAEAVPTYLGAQEVHDGLLFWNGDPIPEWSNSDNGDTLLEGYQDIWESINGPGSWDPEKWVWAIKFEKPEEAITDV